MIFSITGSKDTTLYLVSSSMNTGLDEILEIQKMIPDGTNYYISRSLIKFNINQISQYGVSGSRQFLLKLFVTQPTNIPSSYTIEINAVSQSWTMGVGKYFNEPITEEGASWYYRSGKTTLDYWKSGSQTEYGGTWYTGDGLTVTQSYEYQSADIYVDVTSIVEQWINETIPNEGFILKFTSAEEINTLDYGTLKFFSTDTNTIYKPRLYVGWDESTYVTQSSVADYTGSLGDDSVVYIKSFKKEYRQSEINKILVVGRDRYPTKTFVVSASQYIDAKVLPTSSYYSIQDAYTGESWIPFSDNYTKISYDGQNYFNCNFNGLPSGRLYKFVFKVVQNSLVKFFDGDFIFKVVR